MRGHAEIRADMQHSATPRNSSEHSAAACKTDRVFSDSAESCAELRRTAGTCGVWREKLRTNRDTGPRAL